MQFQSKRARRIILAFLSFFSVLMLHFFFNSQDIEDGLIQRKLPSLHLVTPHHPFDDRNLWQDGSLFITGMADTSMPHVSDVLETAVRVRGRGNSTWWMGPEKRPLRFRLAEPLSLFDSAYEATDWILLANYFDQSLLRNYSAFYFTKLMNTSMQFVPMAQNENLYINDEYMGVYTLTDERDVNPGRLDLDWDEIPEYSDYFIELDFRAHEDGEEDVNFVRVNHRLYDIRFPSGGRRTPLHIEYVKALLTRLSDAIQTQNFDKIVQLIDLETWIDFYLVQEFFMNKDVYQASVFMTIQGHYDDRRIHMGPVWDFDLSAGNMRYQLGGTQPEGLYVANVHYWFNNLMHIPQFRDAVALRWADLSTSGIPQQTIDHINTVALVYRDEFLRNFQRHPILGTSVGFNPISIARITTFEGHIDFLSNWLTRRKDWLDHYFQVNS